MTRSTTGIIGHAAGLAVAAAVLAGASDIALGQQGQGWVAQPEERIEVLRDYVCFGPAFPSEESGGERTRIENVTLTGDVLAAEVFLSGFNIWYTDGADHEVRQHRVDAFVQDIGHPVNLCNANPRPPETRCPQHIPGPDPRVVTLRLMYELSDAGLSGATEACIGYTVIASTR
jgi:hypothetical protein